MGTTPRRRKKRCLDPTCNGGCASMGYPPSSRLQTDGPCRSTCSASRLSQTKRIRLRPPARSSATGPGAGYGQAFLCRQPKGRRSRPAGQPDQRAGSGWHNGPSSTGTIYATRPPPCCHLETIGSGTSPRLLRVDDRAPQTRVRRHVSAAQRDRRVDGHVRRGLEPFRRA